MLCHQPDYTRLSLLKCQGFLAIICVSGLFLWQEMSNKKAPLFMNGVQSKQFQKQSTLCDVAELCKTLHVQEMNDY